MTRYQRLSAASAIVVVAAVLVGFSFRAGLTPPAPPGMVWIPPGECTIGSDAVDAREDERPAHRVRLHGFWMDETEVTVGAFRRFVEATGYVTTAERRPDVAEIGKDVAAGSLVFTPTKGPVPLDDPGRWWRWTPGASWHHPEGPEGPPAKDDHPVVQVSWEDAAAYAAWAGKRLPTEAEWEYAARGGLEGKRYAWGDEEPSSGRPRANLWQGRFPYENLAVDGYVGTAPVASFAPNGYGLHDMAGNVWEWCADWYRVDTYRRRAGPDPSADPQGPEASFDPAEPDAPKRVVRGGSFLCNEGYCTGYRVSARMRSSPDTSLSHTGFRCVKTP
ncbi:MAG: formylglycine-generating enzyme family protein [Minicystis sp.]